MTLVISSIGLSGTLYIFRDEERQAHDTGEWWEKKMVDDSIRGQQEGQGVIRWDYDPPFVSPLSGVITITRDERGEELWSLRHPPSPHPLMMIIMLNSQNCVEKLRFHFPDNGCCSCWHIITLTRGTGMQNKVGKKVIKEVAWWWGWKKSDHPRDWKKYSTRNKTTTTCQEGGKNHVIWFLLPHFVTSVQRFFSCSPHLHTSMTATQRPFRQGNRWCYPGRGRKFESVNRVDNKAFSLSPSWTLIIT